MTCLADCLMLGLHLASYHPDNAALCDANPGMYARHERTGIQVGVFRNSYCRLSVYAAQTFESPAWHGITAGVAIGAITGYRTDNKTGLSPLVSPSIGYAGWHVAYVPKPPKHGTTSALHLTWEARY